MAATAASSRRCPRTKSSKLVGQLEAQMRNSGQGAGIRAGSGHPRRDPGHSPARAGRGPSTAAFAPLNAARWTRPERHLGGAGPPDVAAPARGHGQALIADEGPARWRSTSPRRSASRRGRSRGHRRRRHRSAGGASGRVREPADGEPELGGFGPAGHQGRARRLLTRAGWRAGWSGPPGMSRDAERDQTHRPAAEPAHARGRRRPSAPTTHSSFCPLRPVEPR